MTLLGKTLNAQLELQNRSVRQFAAACGVAHNTVRDVIDGRRCSLENLRAFCQKISSDPMVQYELLLAHLHDEAQASGLDVSGILIRHLSGVNLQELHLSPEMNAHIGIIAKEAETQSDVRAMIESLAHMIMRAKAAAADGPTVDFATRSEPAVGVAASALLQEIDREKAEREARVRDGH